MIFAGLGSVRIVKNCDLRRARAVTGFTIRISQPANNIYLLYGLIGPGKRRHISGHIVADTNVSAFARARNICCRHKFCVRDTKNVSDFVQKHFASATNVSQFAQPKKHHGQQSVRNNVSSFTRALSHKDWELPNSRIWIG